MSLFLETLNHPAEALERKNKVIAWSIVGITILLNSVFEPILQHFYAEHLPAIDVFRMIKITVLGIVLYSLICAAFFLICKIFGSGLTFMDHLTGWGTTYTPTALCAVVVAVTEVFYYVFWNSTIWGMLLSFVFIGILIWKAILYCIYLRDYANLKGWRFVGAGVVMGAIIILMAAVSGYLGMKTPII